MVEVPKYSVKVNQASSKRILPSLWAVFFVFCFVLFSHLSSAHFAVSLKPQVTILPIQVNMHCSQLRLNEWHQNSKFKPCRGPFISRLHHMGIPCIPNPDPLSWYPSFKLSQAWAVVDWTWTNLLPVLVSKSNSRYSLFIMTVPCLGGWTRYTTQLDSWSRDTVVGRLKSPKTSHGKRAFAGTRWDQPELSGQAQCDHKNPYKRKGRGQSQRGEVLMETEVRGMSLLEGATSPGMQVASRSWKSQGNGFSLGASRRNTTMWTPWF